MASGLGRARWFQKHIKHTVQSGASKYDLTQSFCNKKLIKVVKLIGLLSAIVHLTMCFSFIHEGPCIAKHSSGNVYQNLGITGPYSYPKSKMRPMVPSNQVYQAKETKLPYYIQWKSAFGQLYSQMLSKLPKQWCGGKCTNVWKTGSNVCTRPKSLQKFFRYRSGSLCRAEPSLGIARSSIHDVLQN